MQDEIHLATQNGHALFKQLSKIFNTGIPADAPRAGPLLSTASAQATPVRLARHARRTELRSLVEAVQAAHEETFELTPIGLEAAPGRSLKPQVYAQVKPTREAPSEPHETKVA
jgi:hypothetical protein